MPRSAPRLSTLRRGLVRAYRFYWFYATPSKLVVRRTVQGFFEDFPPRRRVLEIGGGTGMMKPLLQETCRPQHLICSDIDPTEATGLVCDARALPFPDRVFDVVAAFEVLEHVGETATFLREVRRVLSEDGFVVLSVPFLFGTHDYHDFYRFTAEGLRRTLGEADLHVLVLERCGGVWFTVVTLVTEYVKTVGVPRSRGWRSREPSRRRRLAVRTLVTAPLVALSWLALLLDRVVDRDSDSPNTFVVIAQRRDGGAG